MSRVDELVSANILDPSVEKYGTGEGCEWVKSKDAARVIRELEARITWLETSRRETEVAMAEVLADVDRHRDQTIDELEALVEELRKK